MGKIIAVYNVKLTVRSVSLDKVDLTNDEVGDTLAESLADAITDQVTEGGAGQDIDIAVNATSVERAD